MRSPLTLSAAVLSLFAGAALAQPSSPAPTTSQGLTKQAPAKTPLYNESADAKQQIAAALAKAKKENRRVLVQWGGNWCPWCIRLHEFYGADKAISKKLMYEYDVVFIDSGKPAGKNVDLATTYGADLEKNGYPFLTILDANGKVIANQETSSLEAKNDKGESLGVKDGYNSAAVLKFLTDHQAAYESATERLDHAIAEAKKADKVVFLHFGAPWCIWCHRLEDWMDRPEVHSILSRHFIDCKIDEDRNIGGKDVEAKYTEGKQTGIPVFFFVSGEGKVLTSSMPGGQNIGFPSQPKEIEHFETMLKSAAKAMSAAEIQTLVESLKTTKSAASDGGH